jgi:glycosyltransferase involved in cell wall biosynthesis
MACGTPVVLASSSALCEVGGDAAAYFQPGSSEDLSAVLFDVIGDATSTRDLSQQGRTRASLFSWAKSAAATAQVYRQLV